MQEHSLKSYVSSLPSIGHIGVPPGLCIKTRLRAQPLIWNSFSQERLCTWPHFESECSWNLEVAYYFYFTDLFFALLFKVSLSGKQTGNDTEKFVGFIINIYNDFTDEPSGDFVTPLPQGVKEEECHYEGRSYIVSRVHYIRRYKPVADPGEGPRLSPTSLF